MTTACVTSRYFSGQGALLLATVDAGGVPQGFRPVGNVSALTIGIEIEEFEHKESCTGNRAIDLTLITETNVNVNFTMESLTKENLALALFGADSSVAAGAVIDENVVGFTDLWTPLEHIKVSSIVVTDDPMTLTHVLGVDYEENLEAGTIKVIAGGGISNLDPLLVDYSFADQEEVQGFTSAAKPIRAARFEGLNTAETDNPAIVNIHKMEVSPLAELALINDEVSQMEIESTALSDATKVVGSKFFEIKLLAAP